jgi:hypothetical protein
MVLCLVIGLACPSLSGQVHAQGARKSQNQLIVNLNNRYRPVSHVASGSLYGLAAANTPSLKLIKPLKPATFVQMAPDGQQLPNGETKPAGDALKVADLANRAGAKITIRFPDIYPNFPYRWVSWDDWLSKVDAIVQKTLNSGVRNIYGYELWNEPDGTWNTSAAGSFNEGWKRTYNEVKKYDAKTPIVGPSISSYNESFMKSFLTYAKANHCLPDIISWHQWDAPSLQSKVQNLRKMEKALGISPRPISINEYGWRNEEAVPGATIPYIAQFERDGVQTANMAFWYQYGRLSNLLTDRQQANGGWWLYKWYGDMTGQMVMTRAANTSSSLDGIANLDSKNHVSRVIVGGAAGNNAITVKGFRSATAFKKNVHVELLATPWYGVDTAVKKPKTVLTGTFKIINGQITIPVKGMQQSWGYEAVITPTQKKINGKSKINYPKQSNRFILRKEAEEATINHGIVYSGSYASNAQYVGSLDDSDSYVQFHVKIPTTGKYTLEIGYANGHSDHKAATDKLFISNHGERTLSFPYTGGWTNAVPNSGTRKILNMEVNLSSGKHSITLQRLTNFAEIDYIQLTKAK